MTTANRDASTFRGRFRPGAQRCLLRIMPESEEYRVGGKTILYLMRPASHEGFVGEVTEECQPYYDAETGTEYKPQYLKGMVVVVGKFTGTKIVLNRDTFIVCRESDILGELIPEANEELPRVNEAGSNREET